MRGVSDYNVRPITIPSVSFTGQGNEEDEKRGLVRNYIEHGGEGQ